MEASGKSTLLVGLAAWLSASGIEHIVTREPGGTAIGARLRELFLDPSLGFEPLTEAFVLGASRAQLLAEVIRPALETGNVVLCDRFTDSTFAYQGSGRGMESAVVASLVALATGGLVPALTFLIDVNPDVSRERRRMRALALGEPVDRLERESDAFHARVRDGYLALATAEPGRIVTLDGTLEPAVLLERALGVLERRLA